MDLCHLAARVNDAPHDEADVDADVDTDVEAEVEADVDADVTRAAVGAGEDAADAGTTTAQAAAATTADRTRTSRGRDPMAVTFSVRRVPHPAPPGRRVAPSAARSVRSPDARIP